MGARRPTKRRRTTATTPSSSTASGTVVTTTTTRTTTTPVSSAFAANINNNNSKTNNNNNKSSISNDRVLLRVGESCGSSRRRRTRKENNVSTTTSITTTTAEEELDQQPPIVHSSVQASSSAFCLLNQLIAPLDPHLFLRDCFRSCAVHIPVLPRRRHHRHNKRQKKSTIHETRSDDDEDEDDDDEDNDNEDNNDDDDDDDVINNNNNSTSGVPSRIEWIREKLFDLDPEALLRETSSENIFVWLQHQHQHRRPPQVLGSVAAAAVAATSNNNHNNNHNNEDTLSLTNSIEVADADAALALYKAGHATYCRAPPHVERYLVSALLSDTGLGCGQYDPTGESLSSMGRGEVEVFMSAQPGHKTDWHYDFQENFTIQLSGIKQWTLQKSTVKHPIRAVTPHYKSPEAVESQLKAAHLADPKFQFQHPTIGLNAVGTVETVLLHPGDVLYFPAGMWHKVQVIEPGVSINISLMATNYASITCQALQHYLLKKDQWREAVVSNMENDVIAKLKTLLSELPGIIQDFEKQGGAAEAMLPPATRNGGKETFAAAAKAIDSSSSSEHANQTEERVQNDEVDNDEDDDDDDDDEEKIIDTRKKNKYISNFSATELREHMKQYTLARNPLASMIREEDIYSFYKRAQGDEEHDNENYSDDEEHGQSGDDENDGEIYLLNVNYAGSESHESAVRVRIRGHGVLFRYATSTTTTTLAGQKRSTMDGSSSSTKPTTATATNKNYDNNTTIVPLPSSDDWIKSETERLTLGFLVYYGYLLWLPKNE